MKIKKSFSKFEDFRRRMTNKMFFEAVNPGRDALSEILNLNFKIIFGYRNNTKKLADFVLCRLREHVF